MPFVKIKKKSLVNELLEKPSLAVLKKYDTKRPNDAYLCKKKLGYSLKRGQYIRSHQEKRGTIIKWTQQMKKSNLTKLNNK